MDSPCSLEPHEKHQTNGLSPTHGAVLVLTLLGGYTLDRR